MAKSSIPSHIHIKVCIEIINHGIRFIIFSRLWNRFRSSRRIFFFWQKHGSAWTKMLSIYVFVFSQQHTNAVNFVYTLLFYLFFFFCCFSFISSWSLVFSCFILLSARPLHCYSCHLHPHSPHFIEFSSLFITKTR